MALLQSRITSVRDYLASQFMNVDEEWISGCVEFISEDSSNNYTLAEIQNLAKEQWLLNDLKDICPGCLPPNLSDSPKTTLNGRYVLQISAAIDIGTPAYQQYLKLQKANMENIEATSKFDDKVPSHRMMKLYLTDGKQQISGIEYRPMRNLSCDITPGCKMLLKGPIVCRRGVLLLTESSIELLGGEVQEIAVSNSLAGLLASKLELPLPLETDLNTTSIPRNVNIPTPHTIMPPSRPNDEPSSHVTSRPVARVTSVQVANFDEDIDFDQLEAIEAEFSTKRSLDTTNLPVEKKIKMDTTLPILPNRVVAPIDYRDNRVNDPNDYPEENDFNEDEDYLRELEANFDRKDQFETKDQFGPKDQSSLQAQNRSPRDQIDPNCHKNSVGSEDQTGFKDQIGSKGPNIGPIERGRPISVSSEPFVYIKQIESMSVEARTGKKFRVKGQIMKLLSKLSVGKEGWSLKCTIIDGTGSLNVDFTSEVLSKLVGYTPQEMNQLKKEMATKPELKQKAVAALHKAKEALQVLYCIIELQMMGVPKITALIQFDGSHVTSLRKRLDGCGL